MTTLIVEPGYRGEALVEIPRRVAICPVCKGTLSATCYSFDELFTGFYKASGLEANCKKGCAEHFINEYCDDDEEMFQFYGGGWRGTDYDIFEEKWPKVEEKVNKWIDRNCRFDLGPK